MFVLKTCNTNKTEAYDVKKKKKILVKGWWYLLKAWIFVAQNTINEQKNKKAVEKSFQEGQFLTYC